MLPVLSCNLDKSFNDMFGVRFNGELAPVVKAAWCEIDRSNDRPIFIGQQDLPLTDRQSHRFLEPKHTQERA